MIVLSLLCDTGHAFDGWFASTEAFDQQLGQGQVACPLCNSTQVNRLPSGPRVKRSASAEPVATAPTVDAQKAVQAVIGMLAQLAGSAEDVSTRFAEEARKIHYGEAESRAIKGKATAEETSELLEEGIPVLPLPVPDKDSMH